MSDLAKFREFAINAYEQGFTDEIIDEENFDEYVALFAFFEERR